MWSVRRPSFDFFHHDMVKKMFLKMLSKVFQAILSQLVLFVWLWLRLVLWVEFWFLVIHLGRILEQLAKPQLTDF